MAFIFYILHQLGFILPTSDVSCAIEITPGRMCKCQTHFHSDLLHPRDCTKYNFNAGFILCSRNKDAPAGIALFYCFIIRFVNFYIFLTNKLSRIVRKPDFCLGENKGADQLRGNREADQRLCFRYSDSAIPPLLKSKISSF